MSLPNLHTTKIQPAHSGKIQFSKHFLASDYVLSMYSKVGSAICVIKKQVNGTRRNNLGTQSKDQWNANIKELPQSFAFGKAERRDALDGLKAVLLRPVWAPGVSKWPFSLSCCLLSSALLRTEVSVSHQS